MEPFVQKQFDEYQANRTEKEIVSEKTLRDAIIKDLSFVSQMGFVLIMSFNSES